ncbi:metallophosphoesterase [Fulvitalea axinellae]
MGQGPVSKNKQLFLVKPYMQFGTQNSMVILWETTEPTIGRVEFGEALPDSEYANISKRSEASGRKTMHEHTLKNLKPETNYFWRVVSVTPSGEEAISEIYSFKTAVKDSSAYMFALVGDSQRNGRTPWAWEKISKLVWEDRPNFVIHAGDLVDSGDRKTDWTEHFLPGGHIFMSRFPMYTVLGNHEGDSELYYQYMANPSPENYYTFKYGNAQFFMVDTNFDVSEGTEQYNWLEWELAKSDAMWKIVVHHHPPYSSEENDNGDTYKELSTNGTEARNLVPLYDKYGVDFNLYGHVHMYERTWPLKDGMVNQEEGVIYINSGGAGGGLEGFAPTRTWFSLEQQTGHHYCTFAVHDRTVIFKAIDHEGRLFDSFQLKKNRPEIKAEVLQPPVPRVYAKDYAFSKSTRVKMNVAFPDLEIRYTLDGTEPSKSSRKYEKTFEVSKSATVRARAYTPAGLASRSVAHTLVKMKPLKAKKVRNAKPGVRYAYYEGEWKVLPDFSKLKPVRTGVIPKPSIHSIKRRKDYFGVTFEGYLQVDATKAYSLYLLSDDGSKMYIDDTLLIDNDGDHGVEQKEASLMLEKGKHKIRIEYFDTWGTNKLDFGFVDTNTRERTKIFPTHFSH